MAAVQRNSSTNTNIDAEETKLNEPNPPFWPPSVHIIRPTDDPDVVRRQLQKTQDPWNGQSFSTEKHFSDKRHALLFAPGIYREIDVEIGYYVQLAGLGVSPDDVMFTDCERGPYVPALNKHLHPYGSSLDTFWRSAENFYIDGDMQWAVSQAAPLRRVHVGGDLFLHDKKAFASGGHLANSVVNGQLRAGGQQQFLVRHVHLENGATGGAWSMVYSGCTGNVPLAAVSDSSNVPTVTVVAESKIRMEKPYIVMKDDGMQFALHVPRPLRPSVAGPLLNREHEDARDFSRVRVVCAHSPNPTQDIQAALDQGKDVVLAPGIFVLERTLELGSPDQVLLGLGLATLVAPSNGTPCIHIAPGVPGVRITGVMLEASGRKPKLQPSHSPSTSSSLLEWGDENMPDPGDSGRPGGLFDVFCRVGGALHGNRTRISVDSMVRLHSGNIVGDNLWLWRADHGVLAPNETANYPHISPLFWQSEQDEFRAETGVEVNGDDIHVYGLAVEHASGHQTVWNGERGSVEFYQCEFPYGVGTEFAKSQFRGYLVGSHVKDHKVSAAGIYSNFRNEPVVVSNAIEHPDVPGISFENPFTVKLDNHGGIEAIVNGHGQAALEQAIPMRI